MSAEATLRPTVTVEERVDEATARDYHALYRRTFGALATRAVARQVLHESEFMEEMRDPRVHKYVARMGEQIVGMSTLTSDLETVPWISPDYFAHHYPEHAARGAVYYLGFTLVSGDHRRSRVFQAMIERVVEVLVAQKAVCAWDICAFNDDSIGFGDAIEHFLHGQAEVTVEKIDRQTYYAGTFAGPVRGA